MPRTRKQAANGDSNQASSPATTNTPPSRSQSTDSLHPPPPGPLSIIITDEDRDVIKVNNANISELKNACDDALKRVRSFTLSVFCQGIFFLNFVGAGGMGSSYQDRICSSNNTCIRMYD